MSTRFVQDDEQVIARRRAARMKDVEKGQVMEQNRFNATVKKLLPENQLLYVVSLDSGS
jgi:hypothetical protein